MTLLYDLRVHNLLVFCKGVLILCSAATSIRTSVLFDCCFSVDIPNDISQLHFSIVGRSCASWGVYVFVKNIWNCASWPSMSISPVLISSMEDPNSQTPSSPVGLNMTLNISREKK